MKIKKAWGVVLALMFFVIGPPGVFAGDDCRFKEGRYLNLDIDSKNFTKCVEFGSRCAEKGSDDCNENGRKPLYCDDQSKKCVERKQNGDSCRFSNECISSSCPHNTCVECSSARDCPYYHVIGTRMDFKKYPCVRGKCFIPFEPY